MRARPASTALCVHVEEAGRDAGGRGHLGDAVAHGAGADDGDAA